MKYHALNEAFCSGPLCQQNLHLKAKIEEAFC